MILYHSTDLKSLNNNEIGRLKRLSLKFGDMRILLKAYQSHIIDNHGVVLATDNHKIVGWAIIYDTTKKGRHIINLFVSPPYRKKKIGSKLIETLTLLNKDKELEAFPWDSIGKKCFDKFPIVKTSDEVMKMFKGE